MLSKALGITKRQISNRIRRYQKLWDDVAELLKLFGGEGYIGHDGEITLHTDETGEPYFEARYSCAIRSIHRNLTCFIDTPNAKGLEDLVGAISWGEERLRFYKAHLDDKINSLQKFFNETNAYDNAMELMKNDDTILHVVYQLDKKVLDEPRVFRDEIDYKYYIKDINKTDVHYVGAVHR